MSEQKIETMYDLTLRCKMLLHADIDTGLSELGTRVLIVPVDTHDFTISKDSESSKWSSQVRELPDGSVVIEVPEPLHREPLLPNRVQAIVQSCEEIEFVLVRTTGLQRQHKLYFEPNGDDLLIEKTVDDRVAFRNLDGASPNPIEEHGVLRLPPGCYRADLAGCLVDMRVLPRPECSLTGASDDEPEQSLQSESAPGGKRKRNLTSTVGDLSARQTNPSQKRKGNTHKYISQRTTSPVLLVQLKEDQSIKMPASGTQVAHKITQHGKPLFENELSKVIIATNDEQEGRVVIKQSKWDGRLHTLQKWLREYKVHRRLNNPAIVTMFRGDSRFLTFELEHIDGGTLLDHPWRGKKGMSTLSEPTQERVMRDIATGLHYLHRNGVVHNDIKLENILFSEQRGAVICDFEHATETPDPPRPFVGGSRCYLPPEWLSSRTQGKPGDIWAAGVVGLYVVGAMPCPEVRANPKQHRPLNWNLKHVMKNDNEAVATMQEWLSEVAHASSQLDPSNRLEEIIQSMLTLDPSLRITAEVLNEVLNEGAELLPIGARPGNAPSASNLGK